MTITSGDMTGSHSLGRDARKIILVNLPDALRDLLPKRLLDMSFDDVNSADFGQLSSEVMDLHAPDTVLAPLLTQTFDAVELAEYLGALSFEGRLVVVSETLPNPALVKREIARAAPRLEVELHELRGQPQLREV